MDFTMAQAKRDFDRGFLRGWSVWELGLEPGWTVRIQSKMAVDGTGYLVDARTKQPRVFKTLDSAVSAVRQVGFKVRAFGSDE